jgi:hypothetical protein
MSADAKRVQDLACVHLGLSAHEVRRYTTYDLKDRLRKLNVPLSPRSPRRGTSERRHSSDVPRLAVTPVASSTPEPLETMSEDDGQGDMLAHVAHDVHEAPNQICDDAVPPPVSRKRSRSPVHSVPGVGKAAPKRIRGAPLYEADIETLEDKVAQLRAVFDQMRADPDFDGAAVQALGECVERRAAEIDEMRRLFDTEDNQRAVRAATKIREWLSTDVVDILDQEVIEFFMQQYRLQRE